MRATTASTLVIAGNLADLAHPDHRFGAGQQPIEHGAVARRLVGVDHPERGRLEILLQLGERRHALVGVALKRRQIDARAGKLAGVGKLAGKTVAAIDGALQARKLQRQHDALGRGLAVGLALDDALHVPLQARELAGERRHDAGNVLGPGEGREPRVDLGLQLLQLVPCRPHLCAGAVGLGLERVEAGGELAALGF